MGGVIPEWMISGKLRRGRGERRYPKRRADACRLPRDGAGRGNSGIHLGGSCSAIEILATLYFGAMRFDPMQSWRLSCATASFSARDMGFRPSTRPSIRWGLVSDADLRTFKQEGSRLTGHPSLGMVEGIDFASGSLGQGLSLGVGTCLRCAARETGLPACSS